MSENTKVQNCQCANTSIDKKEDVQKDIQVKYQNIQPDVDIEEAKDDYIVTVDMPGLDPSTIDVKLDKEILTVEAKSEIEGLAPRHYYRQFRVMRGLDAAQCRADYKHGVLTLKLAKPLTEKPQQIKISCEA